MRTKLNILIATFSITLLTGCATGPKKGDFFGKNSKVVLISLVDAAPGQTLTANDIGFEIIPLEAVTTAHLDTDHMLELANVPLTRTVARMDTLLASDFR